MTELHHVKIRSKNCILTSERLISEFDLQPIAFRSTEDVLQIVFTAGQTVFIVTEVINKREIHCHSHSNFGFSAGNNDIFSSNACESEDNLTSGCDCASQKSDGNLTTDASKKHWPRCADDALPVVFDNICHLVDDIPSCYETIYDVAFTVKSLTGCLESVISNDGKLIVSPTQIETEDGIVVIAVIKSCVGNVFHTLIDPSQYTGPFLPGYRPIEEATFLLNENRSIAQSVHGLYTWADHVTYAVHRGTSVGVLCWYENVFGMKRFFLNRDDSLDSGFVIRGKDVGLRLFALNFWKCAEVGLKTESNLTIVLAESLEGQGPNQVDTFLSEHGCPGVQHIGLGTCDIYTMMEKLKRNGVRFMIPPPTYYTKVGKSDEIEAAGEDLGLLEKYGILLDSEADEPEDEENRFLMQVFTAPLFARDTFFLEVIQRKGARGFGAGNIAALWRSVEVYLRQKKP